MKASQVLALTAACCSVAAAAAVPDSNAEIKPIVPEEHRLEARASVPEELFGQILDFEIEATIKAITSIVKAPERESAFTHRTPSNIVTNFWNRGFVVAAFCTKFLANCQNCHWREYSVGGSGGDNFRCGVLALPGSFDHTGPLGWVNWGYAWPRNYVLCPRSDIRGGKRVSCVYTGGVDKFVQGKSGSLPALSVDSSTP